ncbi:MAG: 50S ribosomal protein L44e [DPANN group archaeon]|nr:50S ribosomal protein L44e [DPANN group archaeon]
MKKPKIIMRYSPFLKKHTQHKVIIVKKKQASSLSYGSKKRARKRGLARGAGNLGRYSKPAVTKFKLTGAKTTKKFDIVYECMESKKRHTQKKGRRAKRLELV